MIDEERLRAGAELYEHYYAAMIRRAERYASDPYDAEDIVSNYWIRLLPKIQLLIEMDEPARSAYLMTTVQNESLDCHRKIQRLRGKIVELNDDIVDSEDRNVYDNITDGIE